MSEIASNPPHVFEIAMQVIPNLSLVIDPVFLAAVLPAAVAPLFLKSASVAAEVTDTNDTAPAAASGEMDSTGT